MELGNRVQILDKAVCVSLCNNVFKKGMNPLIVGQSGFFSPGETTSLGEGKL